jgi:hypothetical protein
MFARIRVQVPRQLTPEQRQLYEQLRALESAPVGAKKGA